MSVPVVAGVGEGRGHAGTEAARGHAGLLDRGVPAGGGRHRGAVGVPVLALLAPQPGAAQALVPDTGRSKPDVGQGPGVVVILVSGEVALVAGPGAGVVVDPLLAPLAVGHDGPVLTRPEHVAIGVTCAAAGGHASVMGETEPVGDLVTEAVVTKSAAFPHCPNSVA